MQKSKVDIPLEMRAEPGARFALSAVAGGTLDLKWRKGQEGGDPASLPAFLFLYMVEKVMRAPERINR